MIFISSVFTSSLCLLGVFVAAAARDVPQSESGGSLLELLLTAVR